MTQDKPLVSVIVRTKDRPATLLNAIRSIAKQTFRPLEVVLVNDGGSAPDITEIRSILAGVPLVYEDLASNKGRSAAANSGIGVASGGLIAFLDDDDEYLPDHLSALLDCMQRDEAFIAYADCEIRKVRHDKQSGAFELISSEPFLSYDFDPSLLLFTNYIPLICALFRREVFDEVGRFDTSFELYEDWDLLIRASRAYQFTHLQHISSVYNKWDAVSQITMASTGADAGQDRHYYMQILEKHRDLYSTRALYDFYGFYNHLSAKYRETLTSVSGIGRELRVLGEEKVRLEGENTGLWNDRTRLTADLEIIGREKIRLEGENTELWDLRGRLEDERGRLADACSSLKDHAQQLEADREELQSEKRRLEAGNSDLSGRIHTQENQLRGLGEQNASLSSTLARIYSSRGWRLLKRYYAAKEFISGTCDEPGLLGKAGDSLKRTAKKTLPKNLQIYLKLLLYHVLRPLSGRKYGEQGERGRAAASPFISIIVPVYNRSDFLIQALGSALSQDYGNFEVIAVDDCSTELETREILNGFNSVHVRLRVIFNEQNIGISETMNNAIIAAKGDYIAFLDCDDFLPPHALSRAAEVIGRNPDKGYFFSDRINVDAEGKEIEKISFINRKQDNYLRELMKGMFTDHLKVIRREAFLDAGLHDRRFDSVQDYEFALRYAFRHPTGFGYINDYLYFHRVYPEQISTKKAGQQQQLAQEAKDLSRLRVSVRKGIPGRKISIVVLSFNKKEHTLRCVDTIKKTVGGNFEIIIFDNNSGRDTVELLSSTYANDSRVRLYFSDVNLGCPGGRKKAVEHAEGDYIVTLDNDIIVTNGWIEDLVLRVGEAPDIAGACCRVVFPDNKVQYNGGKAAINGRFVEFTLIDTWKDATDPSTMRRHDCDWIPGGATLYKRSVYEKLSICEEFKNAYEDNDFSFGVRKLGYRLVNCPTARVIHNHVMYDTKSALQERDYMDSRYNHEGLKQSVLAFYRRHGYIIKDEYIYRIFGFNGLTEEEISGRVSGLAGMELNPVNRG